MSDSDPRGSLQGSVLGDFSIEATLGAGGGGTVYQARWGHREVALKVLRAELLADAGERRRFLDEARLLSEINHPGVVRILGFGELPDGRPYLVMERLQGESVADRLRRGPLELGAALRLFDQVAQAVQTLHERGLIHRDIKPENIFLVQNERYAVLLDFGIAKPVDAPDSTVTRQGGVRGTPAYMAPERFFGAAASAATDIYELGVVLFAMLTAQLPWDASDDPVTRLNPRRPSELGLPLPGRLEEELLQAISTRSENRPATLREFAQRIAASVTSTTPAAPGGRRTADLSAPVPTSPPLDHGSATTVAADLGAAPTLAVTPHPPRNAVPTRPLQGEASGGALATTANAPAFADAATTTSRAAGQTQDPLPALPRPPRQRWPLFALTAGVLVILTLSIALVLVLRADRKDRPGPAGSRTAQARVDAAVSHVPKRGPPFDQLAWKMHARNTQVLLRLNHEELKRSTAYRAMMKAVPEPKQQTPLGVLKTECGIDLLEEAGWLSAGLSGKMSDPDLDVMLRGKWNRDQVETCFRKFGEGKGPDPITRKGQLTRVKLGSAHIWIAWPDDSTLMLSTRGNANEAWFRTRLAGRDAAHENRAIYAVYQTLDPADTAWAVSIGKGYMELDFLKGLPEPLGTYLAVRAHKTLILRAAGAFKSEADAKKAQAVVAAKLAKLKSNSMVSFLLDRTSVKRTGTKLELTFELKERTASVFGAAIAASLAKVDWNRWGMSDPNAPRPPPARPAK